MMQTATYPLRGKRHAGLHDVITLEWESAPDVWEPIDLTGCVPRLQVRDEPREEGRLIHEMTEGDGLTLDGAGGTIYIDRDETTDLPAGQWWYDLRLDPDNDDAFYLIAGPFVWEAVVTVP